MEIRGEIVKLILLVFSLGTVLAENWAFVRVESEKYRPSRALKWVPKYDTEVIADAVVGFDEVVPCGASEYDEYVWKRTDEPQKGEEVMFYICRAHYPEDDGEWVLGTVRKSNRVCQIRLSTSSVVNVEHYEILHNVEGAVKLKWKSLNFNLLYARSKINIPPNVVCLDTDYIIARIYTVNVSEDLYGNETVAIGKSYMIFEMIDSQQYLDHVTIAQSQGINIFTRREVLVEVEPVLYDVYINETTPTPSTIPTKEPWCPSTPWTTPPATHPTAPTAELGSPSTPWTTPPTTYPTAPTAEPNTPSTPWTTPPTTNPTAPTTEPGSPSTTWKTSSATHPTTPPTKPITPSTTWTSTTSTTTTTTTTTTETPTTPTTTPQPTTISTPPAPTSSTTSKNSINLDMTLYFRLKLKIPEKGMGTSNS